jgi:hypothetical protein
MTNTNNEHYASVIIEQMGGFNKLRAMLGVKSFIAIENGVQFHFKGCKKVNECEIVYDYDKDLYNIYFIKNLTTNKILKMTTEEIKKALEPKSSFEGVYCDQLKKIFENETGLYLNL